MFIFDSILYSIVILILVIWCAFFAVGISIAGIIYIVSYTFDLIKSILNKK